MTTPNPLQIQKSNKSFWTGKSHTATVMELLSPESVASLYDLYQRLNANNR